MCSVIPNKEEEMFTLNNTKLVIAASAVALLTEEQNAALEKSQAEETVENNKTDIHTLNRKMGRY